MTATFTCRVYKIYMSKLRCSLPIPTLVVCLHDWGFRRLQQHMALRKLHLQLTVWGSFSQPAKSMWKFGMIKIWRSQKLPDLITFFGKKQKWKNNWRKWEISPYEFSGLLGSLWSPLVGTPDLEPETTVGNGFSHWSLGIWWGNLMGIYCGYK